MKYFWITTVVFASVAWLFTGEAMRAEILASPDRAFIGAGQALFDAVSTTASKVSGFLWS